MSKPHYFVHVFPTEGITLYTPNACATVEFPEGSGHKVQMKPMYRPDGSLHGFQMRTRQDGKVTSFNQWSPSTMVAMKNLIEEYIDNGIINNSNFEEFHRYEQ